jgi:hypothetical protein
MAAKEEYESQEEVPDFLHFLHDSPSHDHQAAVGDKELKFCSDQVDWNAYSHTIDWNNPTPDHKEHALPF